MFVFFGRNFRHVHANIAHVSVMTPTSYRYCVLINNDDKQRYWCWWCRWWWLCCWSTRRSNDHTDVTVCVRTVTLRPMMTNSSLPAPVSTPTVHWPVRRTFHCPQTTLYWPRSDCAANCCRSPRRKNTTRLVDTLTCLEPAVVYTELNITIIFSLLVVFIQRNARNAKPLRTFWRKCLKFILKS